MKRSAKPAKEFSNPLIGARRMWMRHVGSNPYHPPKQHCVRIATGRALCGAGGKWEQLRETENPARCDRCSKREAGLFNPRLGTGRRHPKLHPTVNLLFDIIQEVGMTEQAVATRIGLNRRTLEDWRSRQHQPSFFALECAFNALGAKLVVVMPPGMNTKLRARRKAIEAEEGE